MEQFLLFQSADCRRIMTGSGRLASMGSAKVGSAKLLITRRSVPIRCFLYEVLCDCQIGAEVI